jgi:N-acyl-D-aspartate/D-glutamate deacylase
VIGVQTGRLVIRGGDVVDGEGRPRYQADVAVEGDRVVEIGTNLQGTEVLDATGMVVMPGMIDVHTHYDAQVFWDPALTPSCFMGVTSVVMGNCGYSIAPVGDHPDAAAMVIGTMENVEDMDPRSLAAGVPWDSFRSFAQWRGAVEQGGCVLNHTAYVGHTAVRIAVMGPDAFEREPSEDEIQSMVRHVEESVAAGAMGFATSWSPTHQGWKGKPVPSRLSGAEEFLTLAAPVSARGTGVVEVTLGGPVSMDDLYTMQMKLGVPLSIGGGLLAIPGFWEALLEIHNKGIATGADVWAQVSCRPLTFQMTMEAPFQFNQAPAFRALIDQPPEARRAAYGDRAWRTAALDELAALLLPPRWDKLVVAETDRRPDWIGRTVSDLSAETGESPLDLMLGLALEEDLATRFTTVLLNDDPDGIEAIIQADHTALSFTDAGAHVGMVCDAPMHLEVLEERVRRDGLFTLERAVQKMTSELADVWQLAGRGRVAVGGFADLVVLDPGTVSPGPVRRVRDFPAGGERLTCDQPQGIAHILVNGTVIQRDGESMATTIEDRPGRYLVPGRGAVA